MIILYLTCADDVEASKIGEALLNAKLVACVRKSSVSSTYWWDGKIENNNETLLMMESTIEHFEAAEALVKKLHSYEEFVLTAVPVLKTNAGVAAWLKDNLIDS